MKTNVEPENLARLVAESELLAIIMDTHPELEAEMRKQDPELLDRAGYPEEEQP